MQEKTGLFVGSFDPVHQGHISFIEASIEELGLDKMIVVPETMPRHKVNVEDVKHRKAMLELALSAEKITVQTLQTDQATFPETFKELNLAGSIYLLIGSDIAFNLKTWPGFQTMLEQVELVIGLRNQADIRRLHTLMAHLEIPPQRYKLILTPYEEYSSSGSKLTHRFHNKIADYIQKHHLYGV